jgi:hypothetical protein
MDLAGIVTRKHSTHAYGAVVTLLDLADRMLAAALSPERSSPPTAPIFPLHDADDSVFSACDAASRLLASDAATEVLCDNQLRSKRRESERFLAVLPNAGPARRGSPGT